MEPKKNITKQDVLDALNKTIENKKIVRSYARGEITREEVYAKGIRFFNPYEESNGL